MLHGFAHTYCHSNGYRYGNIYTYAYAYSDCCGNKSGSDRG
jgi:hypothetical protein